jgi:cell division protein FtsN
MATNDPEFYQSPKFTPEPPAAAPRQRGCFFYGCIIASVLVVLLMILVAIIGYFGFRLLNQAVEQYTSTAPRELPKSEMPADQVKMLNDRVEVFRKSLDEGTPAEPLELTSDDVNALIEQNPKFKGKFFIKIEGKEIKGQISYPLDALAEIPFFGVLRGRYLNGEADFKASLEDGFFLLTLDSIEINGKRPPEEMMTNLRQQNLAKDAFDDPKAAALLRKIESLEVKDGKIILKVRSKPAGPSATKKEATGDGPTPAPSSSAPPKVEPPKAEPAKVEAPKAGAEPAAAPKR